MLRFSVHKLRTYFIRLFFVARRFALSHDPPGRHHDGGMEFSESEATPIQLVVGVARRFEGHSRHVRGFGEEY